MISRLALKSAIFSPGFFRPTAIASRIYSSEVDTAKAFNKEILDIKEGPERDVVNFPRYKRPIHPGKVRFGFIPDEWFQFFYNKTGVTGPYVFGISLTTYLLSKEIWVLEHEFYTGLSITVMVVYAVKKFGPGLAKYLDKEIDTVEDSYVNCRNTSIKNLEEGIAAEKKAQEDLKGMKQLFDAKRENVLLQLEAIFRERQVQAYQAVKRRLDYQVEKVNAQRRFEQRHMVNWIIGNVVKSITQQQEKEAIQKCISDLKNLSAKAKAV